MLGRDDDERGSKQSIVPQFNNYLADLLIDEVKPALQPAIWCVSERIGITAFEASCWRWAVVRFVLVACFKLLTDADGLEVHAEDRRNSDRVFMRVVIALITVDLVEDRFDLQ